ncbi:MAG: hypothetical protein ABIK28_00715 [Planctomycetota bacterium]
MSSSGGRGGGAELQQVSSEDPYDASSYHVQAVIDHALVAKIRITDGPPFVFNEWAVDPCPLPAHPHVVSLSRAVVKAEWRKFSLYKILLVEALIHLAAKNPARTVVSAVEPDFPLLPFLLELGIEKKGNPIHFLDPPHPARLGQCIMTEPSRHMELYNGFKKELISLLIAHNLRPIYST